MVKEKIPELVRREVGAESRIELINHLRNCSDCREEYESYLKMFYTIDREIIYEKQARKDAEYENQILQKIKSKKSFDFKKRNRWVSLAAAAIILVTFFTFYYSDTNISIRQHKNFTVLSALTDEDWIALDYILNDLKILNDLSNEPIPVALLIEKLQKLQKQGIQKVSLGKMLYFENDASGELRKISLQEIISSLQKVERLRGQVTLLEISKYISNPEKGGKQL